MKPLAFLLGVTLLAGCDGEAKPTKTVPATIAQPVTEGALTSITLTADAVRRIGIVTDTVAVRSVPRLRTVGGDLVSRAGARLVLSAPRAGTVVAPAGGVPAAGTSVVRGQEVVRLLPLPAEADLFGAREAVLSAEARSASATRKLERAEELLKAGVGTVEAVEDARAEKAATDAELAAAQARAAQLEGGDMEAAAEGAIAIPAPLTAVVLDVAVAPGQRVAAGAALITIEDVDPLWLRVPLYAGDRADADLSLGVRVRGISEPAAAGGHLARRIAGPPTADPLAANVDLWFALPNPDGHLRPGERVLVSLPLRGSAAGLVVPWSAVVRDIYGGTWIYEQTDSLLFVRRRVEVEHVVGDVAVLRRGPPVGARVVRIGAMELFSTEFGPAK